jgi:septum formation protein
MTRLFLASGSPRRAELLTQVGVPHTVLRAPDIDETALPGETPEVYASRLADAKARAGQRRHQPPGAVLGADTVVALNGELLGKPRNDDHALVMLRALGGREHRVISAVCLCLGEQCRAALSVTRVRFRTLDEARLRAYVATGEGRDKAGGYGIQGQGAALVASLAGSYSGVVGLPLEQTLPLLEWAGVPYWQSAGIKD